MFKILKAEMLTPNSILHEVHAPLVVRNARPGQFIILRVDEEGERIPLTIADKDRERGTISLITQIVGATTARLSDLKEGDAILDLVGPLGKPTHIENFGRVACVGGGLGAAPLYPITKALKEAGNYVTFISGARSREYVILEEEFKSLVDRLEITTDDGSYGVHGLVTDTLLELIKTERVDLVVAIGPLVMMSAVCRLTGEFNVPTVVSLNPIMVDGTGMCGSCQVTVGGETKFVCVDGPEFDGHQVDFNELRMRQAFYLNEEKTAYDLYKEQKCKNCQ
ncbi:MAG: sulfide/dihydroorotate dehydrogenase-like FAD/NAD-binding protein [bacterium]